MKILRKLPLYIIIDSLDYTFPPGYSLFSIRACSYRELSGAGNSTHVVSIEGNRINCDGGPIFLSSDILKWLIIFLLSGIIRKVWRSLRLVILIFYSLYSSHIDA